MPPDLLISSACLVVAALVFSQPLAVAVATAQQQNTALPHKLWLLSIQVAACNLIYFSLTVLQDQIFAGAVISSLLYNYAKYINAYSAATRDEKLKTGVLTSLPIFAVCLFYQQVSAKKTAGWLARLVRVLFIALTALGLLFSVVELYPELCWRFKLWPEEAAPPSASDADHAWLAALFVAGVLRLGTSSYTLRRAVSDWK